MSSNNVSLPYFDIVLEQLSLEEESIQQIFGRHVHWGYWPDPAQADGSVKDFVNASESLCQRICEAVKIKEHDQLLDVGCGFGGTIASLNERFRNLDMIGLNIDPRQIDRARQEVKPSNNNKIVFVEGDACKIPLPDASVDVVLAVECIFHFPSRADFFHEARRVLRPGGCLAISDFVPVAFFRPLHKFMIQLGTSLITGIYGPIDTFFTLADYRTLAKEVGFSLSSSEDITRNTLPTYPVVRQVFKQSGNIKAANATAAIGRFSQVGFLRYQILSFTTE